MISLQGKTALITGAGGGIGAASARLLAKAGAFPILTDINAQALSNTAEKISDATAIHPLCYELDVTDPIACQRICADTAQQRGGIDFLIHSAGIYPKVSVKNMTLNDWHQLMEINSTSLLNLSQAVLPYLTDNSAITFISSIAAFRGSKDHAHYSASKGAVISFSKSLALELAPRTRVNSIAPGIIDTEMTTLLRQSRGDQLLAQTPLQRYGTAQEVAGSILFLCSDLASFITGQTLHVNGGLYM